MFLAMTEETTLMITVAITAGMLLLTIFLFLGIRRDRRKFKEEKSLIIDGLLSRTAINSEINSYLSKVGKEDAFSLIRIEIDNYAEAVKQALRKQEGFGKSRLFHGKSNPAPLFAGKFPDNAFSRPDESGIRKNGIIQNGEKVACDYHQADQDFQKHLHQFRMQHRHLLLSAARNEIQRIDEILDDRR